MNVQWAAVRAGLGIGFMGEYALERDANVTALLPMKALPGLLVWHTVHRELRTSARIRAVYDFLADAVGTVLKD
jgi:DNA-binding transcriptional LysR family regulator